ncbi:MAG: IPT/TIG domain-containing protein, partial [Bacteroidales bacterium]
MKNKVVSMGRSADRSSGREIATKSIKRVIALIFGLLLLINVQGLMAQTATAPSGTGTGGDPYLIATLNNLYWVTQNSAQWNKVYKQTANIDASSTNTWQDGGAGSVVGLLPIGNSSTVFNGEYNGQGFTILNLFINRPSTSPVGLFGKIYYGAVIQNLGLVSVNITGSNYSGALVGQIYRYATVLNCYSTGSVSGGAGSIIGGLIGQIHNYDCLYQNLTISKCYSTCNVSGSSTVLGGLIGEAISYYGNLYCGPVIITDCYAMGSVTGAGNVGGFIGGINDSYATNYQSRVEIRNCYSKGLVTASSNAGGFAGSASAYPVTGCYWDTQTSGQATSAAGTGKTTVQMNTQSTFSGWDFSSTWGISAYNSGYPYLQYQPATPSINSVTPGGGVLAGGTTVVLTGYAFTGVTLVKFGANNATSFTVNSATQITAVTPAGSLGQVDITVTTPLGTNSSDVNNHFTYFQGVIYVNASATGANNGSSWTDAYTSLQTAITSAFSSQQIWVAAGTYKPTATTDRTISFVMKEGVAIYGGFAGTETLLTDRAPSVNVTILSGEIGAAGTSDNSYHVVQ